MAWRVWKPDSDSRRRRAIGADIVHGSDRSVGDCIVVVATVFCVFLHVVLGYRQLA